MVDTDRRKKLAFHLRHLSNGLISTDKYEDEVMTDVSFGWLPEQYCRSKEVESDDPIIRPMLELSWCLYGDANYKLKEKDALSDDQIKDLARFILFLHSNLEYEWPYLDPTNPLIRFSFKDILLSAITLGHHYKTKMAIRQREFDEFQKAGDLNYWPFISRDQFEEQLNHPPFLREKISKG